MSSIEAVKIISFGVIYFIYVDIYFVRAGKMWTIQLAYVLGYADCMILIPASG